MMDATTLINLRRFSPALRKALEEAELHPDDAHAWFRVALAANLVGQPSLVNEAHGRAKQCPNFTEELDGDFWRDRAITAIRTKQLHWAGYCIDMSQQQLRAKLAEFAVEGDCRAIVKAAIATLAYSAGEVPAPHQPLVATVNRALVLETTKLRLMIAERKLDEAITLGMQLRELWLQWKTYADPQWSYNFLLPFLLAISLKASQGDPRLRKLQFELLKALRTEVPSGAKCRLKEGRIIQRQPRLYLFSVTAKERLNRLRALFGR